MVAVGNVVASILLLLGVILIVFGSCLLLITDPIIHKQIEEKVKLVNGSQSFDAFLSPPSTVYMEFRFFNVQNSDNVTRNGAKPIVEEIGPYVYREIRDKKDVEFRENGTKLSSIEPKSYVFERSLSAGPENDSFVNVNLFSLALATKAEQWIDEKFHHEPLVAKYLKRFVADFLEIFKESLFEEHTVHEYLWGYSEKALAEINKWSQKIFHKDIISDQIGFFVGKTSNGSNDGEYVVYTGTSDINLINNIDTWQGSSSLPYWYTKYCNMINGTDGTQWHPFISKKEKLYIFSSDICRSLYLTYQKDVNVKGIDLYRFVPPKIVLASPKENPDNRGFCKGSSCLDSGAFDITTCKGAPSIVSLPHFYNGAKQYQDAIEGLHPNEDDHETQIDIEPMTGVAMQAKKKLQINMPIKYMETYKDTAMFDNMTIFPLMWFNEHAIVSDEDASAFRSQLTGPMRWEVIGRYLMIAIGIVLVIGSIVYLVVKNRKTKEKDSGGPLLADEGSSEYDPAVVS